MTRAHFEANNKTQDNVHPAEGEGAFQQEWSNHAKAAALHNTKAEHAKSPGAAPQANFLEFDNLALLSPKRAPGDRVAPLGDRKETHWPVLPDLQKERAKMDDTGKLVFDGIKEHNGMKLKHALDGLSDEQVRTELSKVVWLFNKGLGGGATCAISVDEDSMHVNYLTSDGAGVELYSRPYAPATDEKMAADFNDPAQRKQGLKDALLIPEEFKEKAEMSSSELELYTGIMSRDGMKIRSALSHMRGKEEEQIGHVAGIINRHAPFVVISPSPDKLKITFASYPGEAQELYSGSYPGKH